MDTHTIIHPSFGDLTEAMIQGIVENVRLLIVIPLMIVLIVAIVRNLALSKSLSGNYYPLIRGFILSIVILAYIPLMDGLILLLDAVALAIDRPPEFFEDLGRMSGLDYVTGQGARGVLQWFRNLPLLIMSWIQEGATLIVRTLVSEIRSHVLVFLYLTGPLALLASIFPGFERTGMIWLRAFIGTFMWYLTLTLLDLSIHTYNTLILSDPTTDLATPFHLLVANLVYIFLYLISPYLTSLYIPSGGTGQVWGKFGGMIAAVTYISPVITRSVAKIRSNLKSSNPKTKS